jgi:hypothetical protein
MDDLNIFRRNIFKNTLKNPLREVLSERSREQIKEKKRIKVKKKIYLINLDIRLYYQVDWRGT